MQHAHHKHILAPMVKIGILPFRIMATKFGAHACYSEELIDKKMLQTRRIINGIDIYL